MKERVWDFVVSLLTSGKFTDMQDKKDMDTMLRLIVLNITYTFASVIIIGMGVSDMSEGRVNQGLLQLIIGFMIFVNLFLLRTELPFTVGGSILTVIFGGFCVVSLITKNELNGFDCLWIYSYPLMSIFTLGLPAGLVPALILLGASALGTFARGVAEHPFSAPEGLIICGVYLFVLILAGVYEYARSMKDTWLVQQESYIREARDRAEAASRAKSAFLANMSHEIRTPMNAIIGMTTIAKTTDDAKRKEYCLEKIESASTHLLGVINDILDMSKIEADKFELSPAEFEFSKMLERVLGVFEFRVSEKKLCFTVETDPALPSRIIADEQRLAQVITNLLTNATKFTPESGSVKLTIRRAGGEGAFCILEISVSDTGIGINKEQQAKLFQSFVQVDNTISRKFGGTGLGLAISKKIVEMMGGGITIESEDGKGSTFRFTVKAEVPAEDTIPRSAEKPGADTDLSSGTSPLAGRRILLAEDVEINREIVVALLESTGITISEAENGHEAVEKYTRSPGDFDLVFMDIHMPEMDGFEATRRIRQFEAENGVKQPAGIPIIAMTANVFREDIEHCLAAGMNGHIGKPLDFDTVMKLLKDYLAENPLARQKRQ